MTTARKSVPTAWGVVFFLIAVVLVFAVIRVTIDSQNIATGVIPEEGEFDRRYAQYPILAYAHIIPGVVYLVLAPFQISRRFRNRHLALHRKMGRILVPIGILSGVLGSSSASSSRSEALPKPAPPSCSGRGSSSPLPWRTATSEPGIRSVIVGG